MPLFGAAGFCRKRGCFYFLFFSGLRLRLVACSSQVVVVVVAAICVVVSLLQLGSLGAACAPRESCGVTASWVLSFGCGWCRELC